MKPRRNLKVSAINYEPRGVPVEVSGRVNAQTSRFRQLEVKSDLSDYCALPNRLCSRSDLGCIFHAHSYDCASRAYTTYFQF